MHTIKKSFEKEFSVFSPNDLVSIADPAYLGAADVYKVVKVDEPSHEGKYSIYLDGNIFPVDASLFEEAGQFINHRGNELGPQTVERLKQKIDSLKHGINHK